jgi:large conductance mechanosensitive channel
MKIVKEFRAFTDFAVKGNMIDLAVSDIIMPPLGLLLGGMNFTEIHITMKDAVTDPATGRILKEAVNLRLGNFIQTLVDFSIIAFSIFLIIKGVSRIKEKETRALGAAPPPTKDQQLLTEIRDLLKK